MAAIASMTAGGVLERFPRLRVAFLEGNCSWLPWLLWRLDEYWQMSSEGEDAPLRMLPSEYFRRQCFISVDADEDQVASVIQTLGDEVLVFSTDYPHPDSHFPEATTRFLDLPIPPESRGRILWDNCARLYGMDGAPRRSPPV
jgi:predicted TIM-barrel fold metal-dependent hydrolase